MNRQEYKQISHDIRKTARNMAKWKTEQTGKKCSTRNELHNVRWWADNSAIDKFGNDLFTYHCVGDYDTGLVWEKRWKF